MDVPVNELNLTVNKALNRILKEKKCEEKREENNNYRNPKRVNFVQSIFENTDKKAHQ